MMIDNRLETTAIFNGITELVSSLFIERYRTEPRVYHIAAHDRTYKDLIEFRYLLVSCDPCTVRRYITLCEASSDEGEGYNHDAHARMLLWPWSNAQSLRDWLTVHRPKELPWDMVANVDDMAFFFDDLRLVIIPAEPMDLPPNIGMSMSHGIDDRQVDDIVFTAYQSAVYRHHNDISP